LAATTKTPDVLVLAHSAALGLAFYDGTWGRPAGMLALPHGSLLFTEEMNGRIFRVSYTGG